MLRITLSILFLCLWMSLANAADIHSHILSKDDRKIADRAMQYAKRGDYRRAVKLAKEAKDDDIIDIMQWMQYRNTYKYNNFKDMVKFIRTHQDWPELKRIQQRAEESLTSRVGNDKIIDFFDDYAPITSKGMQYYIHAKFEAGYGPEILEPMAKKYWETANFGKTEERDFLYRYEKYLTLEDHIKRIDRLLWEHRVTHVKRILKKVDKAHKTLFNARIKLIQNKRGVDKALKSIPTALQDDPGILFERINWRKRKKNEEGMLELLLKAKGAQRKQHKWWEIKHNTIRKLINKKDFVRAYSIAKDHGNSPGGLDYADAEWLSGWLSLRFLKNPRAAYEHFYAMYHNVKYPISLGRAAYWAGRAAEENQNMDIAKRWYEIASKYYTTFYGQMATLKLDDDFVRPFMFNPSASPQDKKRYRHNPLVKAAWLFESIEYKKTATNFISSAIASAKTPGEMALISEFGSAINYDKLSIIASKHAERQETFLVESGYPTINGIIDNGVEKPLIFAVIRQESRFDKSAASPVGASGLMQIMPYTGKTLARQLRLKYKKSMLTDNPDYNVQLGSYYLRSLNKKFSNSYVMTIASYNAGPGNALKWARRNGDPREFTKVEEIIDWIELIPFNETRNYVQRVLENLYVYRLVLKREDKIVDALLVNL